MNVMLKRIIRSTLPTIAAAFLLLFMAACAGDDAAPGAEVPAHDPEEAHEHGEDSHTHDTATAADTAGTYVDTTGAFFSDEPTEEEEHEHGADSHTHD